MVRRARVSARDLRESWPLLDEETRVEGFLALDRDEARSFFLGLSPRGQSQVLRGCPPGERELWARLLAPDDAADVLQELPVEERATVLTALDETTRREVSALLAYAEDQAGGLMSPRFVRARQEMSVEEAIRYVRRQACEQHVETIYYVYVLDSEQRLLGVVSFRELLTAPPAALVRDTMQVHIVSVNEGLAAEAVARVVAQHDLLAVPVLDSRGRLKGIVTVDDVVDVVEAQATEDIHKLGGMQALDIPYMQTGFLAMLRKRALWLAVLFLGELLTATAMARYEHEIAKAVVLALFVPLIISSGGNSGSQASTLVIRAMALGEVRLRDWWRVVRREFGAGLVLGGILALIGLARILGWQALFGTYGEGYVRVAATVSLSLVGVVTWGTLSGAMLPLILRRMGLDPAAASAPLVATLVDVSGLVIYFNVAEVVLRGSLL